MKYLNGKNIIFTRYGSRIRMEYSGGEAMDDIQFTKLFPHTIPDDYVAVYNDKEYLGILKNLSDLDVSSKKIAEEELWRRYFIPTITKLNKLQHKTHCIIWDVQTDRGNRIIRTKGFQESLIEINDKLILADELGNRYYLEEKVFGI